MIVPLVDRAVLYDTREQVYITVSAADPKKKGELLEVQSRRNAGL